MNAASPKRTTAAGYIDLSRVQILIVDDNANARALLSEVLRGLGVGRVYKAADSAGAMSVLRSGGIDMVLADVEMPGMNGLDLVKQIRASIDPAVAGVVVVMVSAQATAARVMAAGVSGANSFLCKPYSVTALVRCMNEGFASRRWAQREADEKRGPEPQILDA